MYKRQELREIKKEVLDNPKIKSYYQTYHELNDLLEDVTKTVFQGISAVSYTHLDVYKRQIIKKICLIVHMIVFL